MTKETTVAVLLITGSLGAGKSAVAQEVTNVLAERGLPLAFVDLDALTELYPRPENDRFNTRVMLENLESVWENYAREGAKALVLARVLEDMRELEDYAGVIPGAAITVVRLTASTPTMVDRLNVREAGSAREWPVARADALAKQLEADDIGHFVVKNEDKSLRVVADEVLRLTGWRP